MFLSWCAFDMFCHSTIHLHQVARVCCESFEHNRQYLDRFSLSRGGENHDNRVHFDFYYLIHTDTNILLLYPSRTVCLIDVMNPLSYGIDCRSGVASVCHCSQHPSRIICHSGYNVLVCPANRRRFYRFASWKNQQFQWHFVAHASLIH